ncbi:hypothetical protein KW787_01260 [Candidatus Pacearchaeota archaeon]|nr:hypothetical protein [Candidatus Pacearchaeota archaeon]
MNKNTYIIIGIVIVCALFGLIEYVHPYNFTKDDNLAQFLPITLEGMKQLFHGSFPLLNFHQYTGSRIFEVGTYAVLYPPMILSYFLAHYVFHNDFLLFEIFVLLHLVAGFVATFYFLIPKTKNSLISFLAGIAFVFSGYVLIASASWYYVIPGVVFMPLIFLLHDKLNKKGLKFTIWLGITRGIYFYAGNAQYFAFACLFELLYGWLTLYQNKWKKSGSHIEKYIISLVITLIIAGPLLISQLYVIRDSARGNNGIINYALSLPAFPHEFVLGSLFVYPFVKSSNVFSYSSPAFIHIYYAGTLFFLLFLAGLFNSFKIYGGKSLRKAHPLLWLGILAIILSFGYIGLIYLIGAFLPIIKNFTSSFKITFFVHFFVISYGAIAASPLLEKIKSKTVIGVFLTFFALLIVYHIIVSTSVAWAYYGDSIPLGKLPYNISEGRVISVFTNSSVNPQRIKFSTPTSNFPEAPLLSQDFATYYGIDSIGGYEPFSDKLTGENIPVARFGVSDIKLNISRIAEYGVKYIIIPRDSLPSHPELSNLTKLYQDKVLVLLVPGSRSYVFSDSAIPYKMIDSGVTFNTSFSSSNNITLNFLFKPGYYARVDGNRALITNDSLGRMKLFIPAGSHTVRLSYWPSGISVGIVFSLGLLLLLIVFVRIKNKIYEMLLPIGSRISRLKFPRRRYIVLGLIILIATLMIVGFILFIRPGNVEDLVNGRTHLYTHISSLSVNPFIGSLILDNVNVSSPSNKSSLTAEKINLFISYYSSFKESLKAKRPVMVFREISGENVAFAFTPSETNESCTSPLYITRPIYMNQTQIFTIEKISLTSQLTVPNRASVRIIPSSLKDKQGKSLYMYGEIAIKKDVSGNISIMGNESSENVSTCIILPLNIPHPFYSS